MSDCDSDDTVLYGVNQKVENDYLAGLRCCDISDNDEIFALPQEYCE